MKRFLIILTVADNQPQERKDRISKNCTGADRCESAEQLEFCVIIINLNSFVG